jgi:hypothetical protein
VAPATLTTVIGAMNLATTSGAPGDTSRRADVDHQASGVELDADHDGGFQLEKLSE